jgi:hypothetical protein
VSDLFDAEGMHFPALCLWQPFAHLPLVDAKPWETRGRPYPAKYHGRRIVVCSTKAYTPRAFRTPALEELCEAVCGAGYEDRLPRGMALYSIVLKGCERTEDMVHRVPPELLASGDFSAGRWAWEWGDAEPFNPFPVHGGQGWFRVVVPAGAFRCAAA